MRNSKMFTLSNFRFAALGVIVIMAQALRPSIAAPQNYVLSFSWQSAFCSTASGKKKECATLKSSSYEAQHLSLHGVWPKSQYCDVSREHIHLDKTRRWTQLPAVTLSDKLRARLERNMPGTASALERHEWVKHGSCSGVSAETYFQKGVDLTDAMNRSVVGVFLNKKIGKRVALSDLQAQVKSSFGAGSEGSIEFLCQSGSGNSGANRNRQNKKSFFGITQDSSAKPEQALIEVRAFVQANNFNEIALDAQHLASSRTHNASRAACTDGEIKILEQF